MAHKWGDWRCRNCGLCGQWGPLTVPRGGQHLEKPNQWADWLHHPCHLSSPERFKGANKIRSGPQVGELAKWPLLVGGSPTVQRRGGNPRCNTSGRVGYIAPSIWGSGAGGKMSSGPQMGAMATSLLPSSGFCNASEWRTKTHLHKGADWLRHPCGLGGPHPSKRGQKAAMANKWAKRLLTAPVRVVPKASMRETKKVLAHKLVDWPRYPCHLEVPTASATKLTLPNK